ncbi:MAG TPA: heavy metal-binding domain-containing protein [Solirubrobacteraceae bacterium]|nr:heavy metal-binding domain-containing protein [Solirubrobacteraceae bacterium]
MRRRGADGEEPEDDGPPREADTIDAATEAELEQSLRQVEAGGIPLSAERRLRELAGASPGGGSFTSDLSVSGWALCHRLGLRPLSQVMGSSIYQVGYQGANWGMTMGSGVLTELDTISEAWNEVRRRALNRLELEAKHAGADAVVGVEVRTGAHDWAAGAIEYVVVGTAVRREGAQPSEQPVMTELSVADYANLARAGIEPAGIVAWTSVFFVASPEAEMMGGLGGRMLFNENREIPSYTQGIYAAREQTMQRLNWQAQQLGASGIVGVRIGHTIQRQEVGSANRSRGGLVVTFDAIGTAVRESGAIQQDPPKTTVDLSIY